MTLSEIRKEFTFDFDILKRKTDFMVNKLHRDLIIKHKDKVVTFLNYVSKKQ